VIPPPTGEAGAWTVLKKPPKKKDDKKKVMNQV